MLDSHQKTLFVNEVREIQASLYFRTSETNKVQYLAACREEWNKRSLLPYPELALE